jgi:hypothetical protein
MKAGKTILIALSLITVGASSARANSPGVAPIRSNAHGHSYSAWAASWWKWALETPAPTNAALDETGVQCASNQSGHVWFLAGNLFGGTTVRSCTVPTGTALFFPMSNIFYGAFLTDAENMRTEEFARSQTACIVGAHVSAEIDGVPVKNPQQYLEESSLFTIHFPTDNVYGLTAGDVPGLTLDPTVDRGYYLLLEPLAPGAHTIHFASDPAGTCAGASDITYHLTVGQ